jgi:hypothetical protein
MGVDAAAAPTVIASVNWQIISALATAAGTLVLAVATFSAVRSSNRSARIAEQALRTGMRPLLAPSLVDAPAQKALWRGGHTARIAGGRAVVEEEDGVIYVAMSLRNLGSGIALLHGWYPRPREDVFANNGPGEVDDFRRLTIDLYIQAGDTGYFESAVRDEEDPLLPEFLSVIKERRGFTLDLLYGDQTGGQRTISRFVILPTSDDGWYTQGARHWNVDMPDPR